MSLPRGPLPAFNFFVSLIDDSSIGGLAGSVAGAVLGGFSECTGLASEIAVVEHLEGGVNDRVHRFVGRATYPAIVLSRGVGFGEDLYLWHESFLKGEGRRRNGLIVLANEARLPIKTWSFERGLPVKWTGPALNAGTSAVAIEQLEIAHEKLTLLVSPGKALAGAAGAVAAALG